MYFNFFFKDVSYVTLYLFHLLRSGDFDEIIEKDTPRERERSGRTRERENKVIVGITVILPLFTLHSKRQASAFPTFSFDSSHSTHLTLRARQARGHPQANVYFVRICINDKTIQIHLIKC